MKRFRYYSSVLALCLGVAGAGATVASATPNPNDVQMFPRFFDDCVVTNLGVAENYPAFITISEDNMICGGGVNLHVWNLSEDGGASSAVFNNDHAFRLGTRMVLYSQGIGTEGGLRISPWWDQFANGYFNVRLPDGEIACFGGVLPFYSFTANHGIHYTDGALIHLEVEYQPHCNTVDDPATIEYRVELDGIQYSSGPLPFGNCTVGEEEHGCYGIMDNARVGGRIQNNFFAGGPADPIAMNTGSFFDIFYEIDVPDCPVQNASSTWGRVKGMYR